MAVRCSSVSRRILMRRSLKKAGFSACVFDVLFNHFYVRAFRQIGEGSGFRALPDRHSQDVEYFVSGFAVLDFLDVCDSCRSCNGHVEFKGDLIASVNDSLLYCIIISGYNFVRHVSDFSRHGRKIDVGINHACAVRIPSHDFAVRVKPMAGPFAGGAAVECSVGFYAVELNFVGNFAFVQA